jgi:predicted Rossmann-fold nucleotide-binding protein
MAKTGLKKIISGGQTGVDRAALDVSLTLNIPCGGWCPKGRKAEDGPLPSSYPLTETPSSDYAQRTEWNVRDSDGTLIIQDGAPKGGTALTIELAKAYVKPCLMISINDPSWPTHARQWIAENKLRILNIAGARESEAPGIYQKSSAMLHGLFAEIEKEMQNS